MTTRTSENECPLWRACDSGSSGVVDMSTATRRTLSCACAVKGNAAAARYTYECRDEGTADRLSGSHRCPRSPTGKHLLLRCWRPSLFRQNKRISTQDYRDGRKDNSHCKLRDLFYFWCGLLLAWRCCRLRLLGWLRR